MCDFFLTINDMNEIARHESGNSYINNINLLVSVKNMNPSFGYIT